jgi:hypothetical protein
MSRYTDPRWQRLRLKVFDRDDWECVACEATKKELQAHHKRYCGELWESPLDDLQTLCNDCHKDLGPHPKGGVYWEKDAEYDIMIVLYEHCPSCKGLEWIDKGGFGKCAKCGYRFNGGERGNFSLGEKFFEHTRLIHKGE